MAKYALTFDDGPGPQTAENLDILREHGTRATFFVLGRNIEEAPWCGGDQGLARALVERALRENHVVGNHTYSHGRPDAWRGLAADLRRCDDVLRARRRAVGMAEELPIPVRLPYGIRLLESTIGVDTGTLQIASLDPRIPVLASMGRTHVHWTSEFADWTLSPQAAPVLAERMIVHVEQMSGLGLFAVLDLHDGGTGSAWGYDRTATTQAVKLFLTEARRREWESFTVPIS
ncbi:MAG: polysaccharide deacetylase family protein [Deltaproteobacteria bacterium]|nr:polysaccharide deacetylase family protein [Deltaproteobacteria bacterium]